MMTYSKSFRYKLLQIITSQRCCFRDLMYFKFYFVNMIFRFEIWTDIFFVILLLLINFLKELGAFIAVLWFLFFCVNN